MNIEPAGQEPQTISDDQELAKVLAGVTGDPSVANPMTPPAVAPPAAMPQPTMPMPPQDSAVADAPSVSPEPVSQPDVVSSNSSLSGAGSDLAAIKQEALGELRPLVDKLEVSPEEKFDTYLLLIRSREDRTLISPAHAAAQAISDETRRAQALLDIIKEIDFLSQAQQ